MAVGKATLMTARLAKIQMLLELQKEVAQKYFLNLLSYLLTL
jgi:hypothetical protein